MTVRILSISARGENEVSVAFEICDGERKQLESFLLSPRHIADLGLSVGDSDKERFDAVAKSAEVYRATKKALTLLSYGRQSPKALQRKLFAKGSSAETAKCAVETLISEGYLDPKADALCEAEKCLSKLWGKKRIYACLCEKGYSEGAIKNAFFELEDRDTDFSELCLERLAQTCSEIPKDPKERQKLTAALIRYGFSTSEIREAIDRFQDKNS